MQYKSMKDKKSKYQDKLEIIIITYNRAKFFERTLKEFSTSPFRNCRFTVLDNCSTDETPVIARKFRNKFKNYHIIRHNKNIGGGGNYVRAVEIARAEYTWIICDDDMYDFSSCDDIIEVIEKGSYDLITVGNSTYKFSERGIGTTTRELIRKKEKYYTVHAFIPSLIFKTSLFSSECLVKSHLMQKDMFPQLCFIHCSVENNYSIYIPKHEIVFNDPNHSAVNLNPFFQFASWVSSCRMIKDKKLRKRVIYEYHNSRFFKFYAKLIYYIYFDKVLGNQGRMSIGKEELLSKYSILFSSFVGSQLLMLLLFTPLFMTPRWIFRIMGKIGVLVYYRGRIPADKHPLARIDPRL